MLEGVHNIQWHLRLNELILDDGHGVLDALPNDSLCNMGGLYGDLAKRIKLIYFAEVAEYLKMLRLHSDRLTIIVVL
jgi:hypothetical protein